MASFIYQVDYFKLS